MRYPLALLLCLTVAVCLLSAGPSFGDENKAESAGFATAEEAATAASKNSDNEAKDNEAKKDENGEKSEEKAEESEESDSAEKNQEGEAAENKDADEKKDNSKDRKTLKIEPKPLKITVESDGVFVAREMTEVKLEPEEWSDFEIKEFIPHGAHVHKGEVLIKFDDKDIKEALETLELDQRINELAILKSEQELPRLEESINMAFAQAERTLAEANKDYKDYQETDRDLLIKSLDMNLKSTETYAESAREELRQLQKMYEADDLTEETEEIILKRQKAAVEQANFALKRAKLSHDRNLNVYLPRRDINEKETLEQVKLAFERAKTAHNLDLNRARYELEKAKLTRAKSLKKHANLTSDLNLLTIKAPADGVVYYGEQSSGKWSDAEDLIKKYQPEKKAATGGVLLTIVKPRPLYVVSTIKEADRPSIEAGESAKIQPTAADSSALDAKITEISNIPVASDKFALELELEEELPDWFVAGMTGKVKITTYEKKEAILVPKKAVHSEAENEDEKYVWLVVDDEVEKREVSTGKTKGDDVEITDGLKAGDVVSLDEENGAADADDGDE